MSSINSVVNLDTLIEFIWSQYEWMIKTSNMTVINIPGHIVDFIGDRGVNSIAHSFSEIIGAPTKRAMNPINGMNRIVPANFHLGHDFVIKGGPEPKHAVTKKEKTPRPPNAFILYRQRHHPLLRAKYPTLHNNQICERARNHFKKFTNDLQAIILGKQWQLADEETKGHFKDAANILKKKHSEAHPNYQYQPRKSSEKKRRMIRRRDGNSSSAAAATKLNPGEPSIENVDVDHGVPDFETTAGGFPTFNLGDDDYDDETLTTMLANFNASLSDNSNNLPGPVLYSEPTEEAQDDYNLFNTFLHFDKLLEEA